MTIIEPHCCWPSPGCGQNQSLFLNRLNSVCDVIFKHIREYCERREYFFVVRYLSLSENEVLPRDTELV